MDNHLKFQNLYFLMKMVIFLTYFRRNTSKQLIFIQPIHFIFERLKTDLLVFDYKDDNQQVETFNQRL